MVGLNELEQAVLDKLLAGVHPTLAVLRRQSSRARLARREYTGVGFFCAIEVDACAPLVERDCDIGDVHAEVKGLARGAGFVLFIRGGRLSVLEGYTYDEPWPDQVEGFSLRYSDPDRSGELAGLG